MSALSRLLTAEEFEKLPDDGSRQELVRGEVITWPPSSFYRGVVCAEVAFRVGAFVDDDLGVVTSNGSGVILERDPDTVRGPFVAYWSRERLPVVPRTGYVEIAPDLAVEVMSPGDVLVTLLRKAEEYVNAGVRLVWIVMPEDQAVTVYRANGTYLHLTNGDTLDGEDVLPGFSCPVAGFFP